MEPPAAGRKKPKQEAGTLILGEEALRFVARKGAFTVAGLRYDEIQAATYSRSKHPRWKAGDGLAMAVGMFAIPIFFMKAEHHWLTFQGDDECVAFRL